MALAINVLDVDNSGSLLHVYGTLTPSGNYVTTGDTLDFTTIMGQGNLNRVFQAGKGPTAVLITSSDGYGMGFVKEPAPAAANAFGLKTGKVKMTSSSATEVSAGAYPAGISGDANIYFHAIFDLNL